MAFVAVGLRMGYVSLLRDGAEVEIPLAELKVGGRLAAIVGQEPVMCAVLVTRVGDKEFRSVNLFDTVAPRLSGFDEPSRFHF